MLRFLARSVVLAATLLCLNAQAGPSLFLHPAVQPVQSRIFVDLMIAGLKDEDPQAVLGGFDITLAFDPRYLELQSVDFDTFLGQPIDTIEQVDVVDIASPLATHARLFSVSLLEAADNVCNFCTGPYLADLQGDSFRLARLEFEWLGAIPVRTSIAFVSAELADGLGNMLEVSRLGPAQIEIPEPGTPALICLGLALLGMRYRSRRRLAPGEGARS